MIPAARQHVKIDGCDGVFIVIWVDQESSTAQVVPLEAGDEVFVHPVRANPRRACA